MTAADYLLLLGHGYLFLVHCVTGAAIGLAVYAVAMIGAPR